MKNRIIPIIAFVIFLASCTSKKTCEICGYLAMDGNECQYCYNKAWDDSMEGSKEEYVEKMQKDFWMIEGLEPDFYGPYKVEMQSEVFYKDTTWKPVISSN